MIRSLFKRVARAMPEPEDYRLLMVIAAESSPSIRYGDFRGHIFTVDLRFRTTDVSLWYCSVREHWYHFDIYDRVSGEFLVSSVYSHLSQKCLDFLIETYKINAEVYRRVAAKEAYFNSPEFKAWSSKCDARDEASRAMAAKTKAAYLQRTTTPEPPR